MVSGYKNMSVPNGGSVRLDEWPAVIPSGKERHIITVVIKVHIFAPSRPFIVLRLKRRQSVCLNDRKRPRLLLLLLRLLLLISISLCELEMLGPESYSDV